MDFTIVSIISVVVAGVAAMLIRSSINNKRKALITKSVVGEPKRNDELVKNNYEAIESWKTLQTKVFDVFGWPDVTFGPTSIDEVKRLAPWTAQVSAVNPILDPYEFVFLYYDARVIVVGLDEKIFRVDEINHILLRYTTNDNGFVFVYFNDPERDLDMLQDSFFATEKEYIDAFEKFENLTVKVRRND